MEQHSIAVCIEGLSKQVKTKQLLSPITYHLKQGKILALCGSNGAGKSTLIRLIIGLIRPTTGHVMLNGLTIQKKRDHFINQFGYMPDDFQFQPSMTTKETIQFYAKLKNIGKKRREKVLHQVGLIDQLNDHVGTFSKGMNQRLLLAQALLAQPPILILDEPTNGLDPYWIKQFSQLMLDAKKRGQTVIFSTHDLHVAEHIADEVLFLSDGEIISEGSINNYNDIGLYDTFQHLYFERILKK